MSFKLTALMLDHGPTDPLAKLIAMALCDRADEKAVCWPSRDDLRKRTGASDSTITRKLRFLEKEKYIQRQQRFNNSAIFRINVLKLQQMEAASQAAKLVTVPKGFDPFQEELDAIKLPQPIDNKGNGHTDHTYGHTDHTYGHSDHLTYQKSINKPRLPRAFKISDLSRFQKACIQQGKDMPFKGLSLKVGAPEYERLRSVLRLQSA